MTLAELKAYILEPDGRELEVASALLEMQERGTFPGGRSSIRDLVIHEFGLECRYKTVARWVAIAAMLAGPDDPRVQLGLSRLAELLPLKTSEQRRTYWEQLPDGQPIEMSVRELRNSVERFLNGTSEPRCDVPPEARLGIDKTVVELALERAGLKDHPLDVDDDVSSGVQRYVLTSRLGSSDAARAVAVAAKTLAAMKRSRSQWAACGPVCGPEERRWLPERPDHLHQGLCENELADLLPGQLRVEWDERQSVSVYGRKEGDGRVRVARIPLARSKHRSRVVRPPLGREPSRKFGSIECLYGGCMRAATRLPQSEMSCFDDGSGDHGCYCNGPCGMPCLPTDAGSDIIRNGLTNDLLRIQIPTDGKRRLSAHKFPLHDGLPLLWRMDAEAADGSMSIALGLFQAVAEANPDMGFTTVCSHNFLVEEEMLCWLASLGNVWVAHSVSGWLSKEEADLRFDSIRRFTDAGVRSVIFLVTSRRWPSSETRKRALRLFEGPHGAAGKAAPDFVIERPYFDAVGAGRASDAPEGMALAHCNRLPQSELCRDDAAAQTGDAEAAPDRRRNTRPRPCGDCPILCGYSTIAKRNPLKLTPHR